MSRDVSKHFECGLNGTMEVFFSPFAMILIS